jgi:ABC-type sugar transport system permease subunit
MRRRWFAYLCVAPPVLQALVFVFIPVVVSLYLSFTRYDPVSPLSWARWVGWDNYVRIFGDPVLWHSLGRSVYFALVVLPVQLGLGVVLAACLDRNLVPDRLYKFVYFAPLVTSAVSVALIWFALLAGAHYGWVNALLLKAKLIADPIDFLNQAELFLQCVIALAIWQGIPFYILILLAGLQSIPHQQYEAAALDGAGVLRQFWHVSLPNLRPQFVFLVIMGTIGAVQVFEQIYMLGGGTGEAGSKFGPDDSGLTMVPFLFRKGFEFLKMGEASAIAYVLFAALAVVTYVNLRTVARGMRER